MKALVIIFSCLLVGFTSGARKLQDITEKSQRQQYVPVYSNLFPLYNWQLDANPPTYWPNSPSNPLYPVPQNPFIPQNPHIPQNPLIPQKPHVPQNPLIPQKPHVPQHPSPVPVPQIPPSVPLTPRPRLPPAIDDEERVYGNREPLQPENDGVIDPEVGLKQSLNKYIGHYIFELKNGRLSQLRNSMNPWWRGPNVCVEREEKICSDEDDELEDTRNKKDFFSGSLRVKTCAEYGSKYECIEKEQTNGETKIHTVVYQCCHGSQLQKRRECVKVELLPLLETIENLNGTEFLTLSRDIINTLSVDNVTIFLPSNEAFEKFSDNMLQTNQVEIFVNAVRRRRSVLSGISPAQLAQSHMVHGINDVSSDDSLTSMFNNSTLQIRHARNGLMVNCAKILNSNIQAINGIVHTIDRVMMPATRTLLQILNDRSDFSIFKSVLEKTDLLKNLGGDEIWTILVPSNKAFENLDENSFNKIMKGDSCAKNILKHHLVSQPLCSVEVNSNRLRIKTAMGEILKLSMVNSSEDNQDEISMSDRTYFYIDDVKVTKPDIVATNGIIHVIDYILFPESGKPIMSSMMEKNLTIFYSLINKAGMAEEIQNMSNVTLFAPTDKAMEQFLQESRENNVNVKTFLEHDEETNGPLDTASIKELRSFILHHFIEGAIQSCDMDNDLMLKTLQAPIQLRTNLYSTLPTSNTYNIATVDCARLVHFDHQQCDNVLHQIDKPLMVHQGTIMEQIGYIPELSLLNKILTDTETQKILQESSNITFLAPRNEAFKAITKEDYEVLLTNKNLVDSIFLQHTVKGVMCCTGIKYLPWPFSTFVKTFNDIQLEVRNKQLGTATIDSCDHVANNGVIHFTNKIMLPRKVKQRTQNSDFDIVLFGI